MTDFICHPAGSLSGELRVPGDKSISHRAIILSSLAEGNSDIRGFLRGEDSLKTLQAFRDLGVDITDNGEEICVHGVGLEGLKAPDHELYMGNSGTAMRLMTGVLAGQPFDSILTGDASLSKRPMLRVTQPLALMGAVIDCLPEGTAPLHIRGGHPLNGIEYVLPVASAQVKSCVLLAGLYARGETCVIEPAPTRDHSERMLRGFGYSIHRDENRICLKGGGVLKGMNIEVPADISSAAFFLVAASIAPDSDLTLSHVGINPTRTGVIEILRLMGADIEILDERDAGGEPVADLRVRGAELKGIDIPEALVPLAIDEFPALFIAAACAEGRTRLSGAAELRIKESDRIQVMADGLNALGVQAEALPDGIVIDGRPGDSAFSGGRVDSSGDHRIAMAFAMASTRASGVIEIHDCDNVNTSFPNFVELADAVGLRIDKPEPEQGGSEGP